MKKQFNSTKNLRGRSNFQASTGWLKRFKSRHGIRELQIEGEKLSADSSAAGLFKIKLRSALLTSEEPTDETIVQNINAKEQLESDGEEEVEEEPLPTAEEALKTAELFS